jgi:hypothetical protein
MKELIENNNAEKSGSRHTHTYTHNSLPAQVVTVVYDAVIFPDVMTGEPQWHFR